MSCNKHDTCGKWAENGTVVRVHCVQAWRRGHYHNDLEVYVVVDGVNTCKVGYLAKEHATEAHNIDGQFLRVVDVYIGSDNDITRLMRYHWKYGYARAILIETVKR